MARTQSHDKPNAALAIEVPSVCRTCPDTHDVLLSIAQKVWEEGTHHLVLRRNGRETSQNLQVGEGSVLTSSRIGSGCWHVHYAMANGCFRYLMEPFEMWPFRWVALAFTFKVNACERMVTWHLPFVHQPRMSAVAKNHIAPGCNI